jgi:hypothetical protein
MAVAALEFKCVLSPGPWSVTAEYVCMYIHI